MDNREKQLKQVTLLTQELLQYHNEEVMRSVKRHFSDGSVAVDEYQKEPMFLAKILLTAALHEYANWFRPLNRTDRRVISNILKF